MSLQDYEVNNDKFEAYENPFCFPCHACKHRFRAFKQEPCRSCGHNANAVNPGQAPEKVEVEHAKS